MHHDLSAVERRSKLFTRGSCGSTSGMRTAGYLQEDLQRPELEGVLRVIRIVCPQVLLKGQHNGRSCRSHTATSHE